MRIVTCLTKPVAHPWLALGGGVALVMGILMLLPARTPHDVSASNYATLSFDGLVSSNGVSYGAFTITNRHRHPLRVSVNNIETRKGQNWTYYATWSPGGSGDDPQLGSLNNPQVSPGKSQAFRVPVPRDGDAWRIHVGVLRGIQGLTLRHRLAILRQTGSLPAAFTRDQRLATGYHNFTFAGMLNGPTIPTDAAPTPQLIPAPR